MVKSKTITRRGFLKGLGMTGAMLKIGLPPLDALFNSHGTAYAAEAGARSQVEAPIESRFLLWFNGNGIAERYWIPTETGPAYSLTPCLSPLAPFTNDFHVISGLDNAAACFPGLVKGHHNSMSSLVSVTPFSGRVAGNTSIDQVIAAAIGGESRFRSLQIGVCQESFGESIQRNMSWAGRDRPLPPEMIPHKLFDRLFGTRDEYWIERKKSILDAVQGEAKSLKSSLGRGDQQRLEE